MKEILVLNLQRKTRYTIKLINLSNFLKTWLKTQHEQDAIYIVPKIN